MGVLPYTTAGYTVAQEAPIQRGGWLMGVVRGIGSLGYSLFRGSGRSNTAGPSGDMVQPFNIGAGSSLANQGISFPPKRLTRGQVLIDNKLAKPRQDRGSTNYGWSRRLQKQPAGGGRHEREVGEAQRCGLPLENLLTPSKTNMREVAMA
ncbi:hypothetical protein OsI_12380 [Oryza sativa Indica Group]|uniref:Uncharacterized protein n=1 Tax=Oryza sativa subsp. indica TaxID=39946 RepID=A2XIW7_ORYSI|nr:hypothetical protein OsI_12380 [Oryza sativa Indica Group]